MILAVLAIALAFPAALRADDTRSYNPKDSIETSHPKWMSWVPDHMKLSELSVPGTHDTMSRYGGDLVETHELTLRAQLDAGIRLVDIRCRHIEDTFAIHHGEKFQHAYFGSDVLKVCQEFLTANPTETILMRIREEYEPADNTRTFNETFNWYRTQTTYGNVIWPIYEGYLDYRSGNYHKMPTLGEVRGKVVVIQGEYDSDSDYSYGLLDNGSPLSDDYIIHAQDLWNLTYTWDRDNKWDYVKNFFRYTDGDDATFTKRESLGADATVLSDPADPDRLYDNSLSASSSNGGVYPNYIAMYINPRALQYLFQRNQSRTTGIMYMDFPGQALISSVIAHNLKYATNTTDRARLKSTFQTVFKDTCYALSDSDYSSYNVSERAEELQQWLKHILPWRGVGRNVRDYWSVVVKEGDRGFDNWAVVTGESPADSLFKQSDWINDRSYVALNAVGLAASVTTNQLQAFLMKGASLKSEHLALLDASGDCQDRARALRTLVRTQFPNVRWNVAVSRRVPLGIALNTRAFVLAISSTALGNYFYYVWAGSVDDTVPVPRINSSFTIAAGRPLLLDASRTTGAGPNTALTYRWDFDNNGTWDLTTSSPTVSRVYSTPGTYTVRIQITDGATSVETTTLVTVNNVAPELNLGVPTADVLAGGIFRRSCFFTDPGNDTWTLTVDYGDGSPVQTLTHLNKVFELNRTYASPGTHQVRVTVNDGTASATGTIAVTVAAPGAPVLQSFTGPAGAVPEGSPVTVSGSFYFGVWSETLTLSWGDGSPDTQPVVLSAGGGNYTFTAQHTYAKLPPGGVGQYTITATWPTWTTRTLPITVVDVPPSFGSFVFPASISEGSSFQVGYNVHASSNSGLVYRADWGDGTSQTWTGGPLSSSTPPHIYTTAGDYLMTIQVTDADQSTALETLTLKVADAKPSVFDFVLTSPGAQEGGTANVLGHFQSSNLANDQFTVEISWGDGSPSTLVPYRVVGQNTAEFKAGHYYTDNNGTNPWPAIVKVTDDDGNTATAELGILVTNVAPVIAMLQYPVATKDAPLTKSGQIFDAGNDTFTGTVNYGDGTGVQPLTIVGNSYQFNHTYAADGVYNISTTVTDDDGASASSSIRVLVGPALTLMVTSIGDSGPGTLRQALKDASVTSNIRGVFINSFAEIRFDPGLSGQTIVLTNGPLVSSLNTRILATNLPAGITISGNRSTRILEVQPKSVLILDSLHLTDGYHPEGGGGILVTDALNLLLNRCTISGCTTTNRGGGILFDQGGSLKLVESTVSGCSAMLGGGIYFNGGTISLENCTLTGNNAAGGSLPMGGAIFNQSGQMAIHHSTVVRNSASGSVTLGGGIHNGASNVVDMNYSIVAGNAASTLENISGPSSGIGNFTSGDPRLLPLGNYGGPTPTMPPRAGSPVIDAITRVSFPISSVPIARWRLGDEDAGATDGGTTTTTTNAYGSPLVFNTAAPYTSGVSPIAAGWSDSRLGIIFQTGTYGTSDLVSDPLANSALTDHFGIELWVKAADVNGFKCLAYNGNSAANGWGLYQFGDTYGGLLGGLAFVGFGAAPVTPGLWTHLALVRDQGLTTLYVNGVAVGATPTAPNVPDGRFAVGVQSQSLNQEYFSGALDDIRVFTFNPGAFTPASLSYKPGSPTGVSYLPGSDTSSPASRSWATDQRGYPRVSGRAADIGAVELEQKIVRVTDDDGFGSLRQAVSDVTSPGIVTFAPTLSGQTLRLTNGQVLLDKHLTIDASQLPRSIVLSGNNQSRVFDIASNSIVTLDSLTITDGSSANGQGGGIRSSGTLAMRNSSLSNNLSLGAGGGLFIGGGTTALSGCTVNGNKAIGGNGGGIANPGAQLVLTQCTLSGNSVSDGGKTGGQLSGGGLSLGASEGFVAVNQCTITANISPSTGGGIFNTRGTLNVFNSIVTGNTQKTGTDIEGAAKYAGVNLLQGSPLLAPLGDYGGPTWTMPPLPGSPAIDASAPTPFPQDQRKATRLSGTAPDIGSVEAFPFSTLSLVDTDGDGADDRMELAYFGTLTTIHSSSDFDGDGSSDVSELFNMTDPKDAGDNLRILSLAPAAGFHPTDNPRFDVTLRTFPGLSYTLQTNATLNAFTDLTGSGFTATNRTQALQIRLTPNSDFLRVRRD